MAEDTLTYARVLAERPPLRRLLGEPGREGVAPFLRRFCETSELDGCAVFDGAQVVATSGANLPWTQLYTVSRGTGRAIHGGAARHAVLGDRRRGQTSRRNTPRSA